MALAPQVLLAVVAEFAIFCSVHVENVEDLELVALDLLLLDDSILDCTLQNLLIHQVDVLLVLILDVLHFPDELIKGGTDFLDTLLDAWKVLGDFVVFLPDVLHVVFLQDSLEWSELRVRQAASISEVLVEVLSGEFVNLFDDVLPDLQSQGLLKLCVTDIEKDGMLSGPSLALYRALKQKYPNLDLIASGGVRDRKDIIALEGVPCEAVIIGKAWLNGNLNLRELC